ncbi:MAG: hypothetical protein ABJC19_09930, partial [Gemmatimonadota bacterium]
MIHRRRFLHAAGAIAAGIFLVPVPGRAATRHRCGMAPLGPHPVPRPGITGAKVLAKEKLRDQKLGPLFDSVREIPGVIDGIRCNCGCAGTTGFYSLLSCYEGDAMAQH